jgi:hypothetical protein
MLKEGTLAELIRVNDNPVENFVGIVRHRKKRSRTRSADLMVS